MSDDSTITPSPAERGKLPKVGPYQAVRVLGKGAMGDVFLAEQSHPLRRQVALKLIRPGMDSAQLVARFERERQALAMMNHPNVARVFDAGEAPDGRPYFVMEYVPGLPITKYCDEHRLGNRDRLLIFKDVCDALQHAHMNGVIHRDIKPSNILVTGAVERPIPKVIDFGVAKALGAKLGDDTFATQFGQFVGTPAYMSPEQANPYFEDVDSRSDVYSLGVLLYELISGVLPFDFTRCMEKGTIGEIQRVILEQDPSLPSTRFSSLGEDATKIAEKHGTDAHKLRRELKGDLDWIAMKALEKDRTRRYTTALDLARDIERHLRSEPVSAGPPTLRYRARKFLRRRRLAVGLTLMGLALAASAAIATVSARRANVVRQDFLRETTARTLSDAKLLALSRPDEAIDSLRKLAADQPDFVDGRVQLAYLLRRQNRLDEATQVAERILVDAPDCGEAHLLLAQIYERRKPELAQQHLTRGRQLRPDHRYFEAQALPAERADEAVRILTDILEAEGTHFEARLELVSRHGQLGDYENMLQQAELLTAQQNAASAWNVRGHALSYLHRFDEAILAFTRAIDLNPDYAGTYLNRADARRNRGEFALAMNDCNRALILDHNKATAYAARAAVHRSAGRLNEALADCGKALSLDARNTAALWNRALVLQERDDYQGALADFEAAISSDPLNPLIVMDRAALHKSLRDYPSALHDYDAILERRPRHLGALLNRCVCLQYTGDFAAALDCLNAVLADSPDSPQVLYARGRLLRWMGRHSEALADHARVIELVPDHTYPYMARAITRLQTGDTDGAIADVEAAVSLTNAETPLHLLTLWQLRKLQGNEQAAAAAIEKAGELATHPWEAKIVAMTAGSLEPADLLSVAGDEEDRASAAYHIGARYLAQGRKEETMAAFGECLRAGFKDTREYDLALAQSQAIGRQ